MVTVILYGYSTFDKLAIKMSQSGQEPKSYIIRVHFLNKYQFVKLSESEITWKQFIDKGKSNIQLENV